MIALEWRDVDLGKRRICGGLRGYMHLSSAALESAIRLLDQPLAAQTFGDMLETGKIPEGKLYG